MSAFDSLPDSAFQLKTEAEEITLSFKQGIPNTGQGTVEWNIPVPAAGCTSEISAYAGMVILLSTEPLDASNIPQNGNTYFPDPTANPDVHVGDKIGNALVVGAIYECEKKNKGEDLTTSIVITDLQPNTPYYVAGYATDCQFRYHSDGIRAYSDSYGAKDDPDSPAQQIIAISNDGSNCVVPTDGTGLEAGKKYEFDIVVDDTYPNKTNVKTVEISIEGSNAGTYEQLLTQINDQIKLVDNPPQSPSAPNTGSFYWSDTEQKLYQFNGISHDEVPVIVEPNDPANVVIGSYWYDTSNDILYRWNIPSPTGWNIIPFISVSFDPQNPPELSYWFDNTLARTWSNTHWCDQITIISTSDPDDCNTLYVGDFWFDESSSTLKTWDSLKELWITVSAIYWPEAPNSLSDGTYWFDLTNQRLHERVSSNWIDLTDQPGTFIQEDQPVAPTDNALWYKPSTEELQQWDNTGSAWIMLDVLAWDTDPSIIESCDAWWNSTNNSLYTWDQVNTNWDVVQNFYISPIDPINPAPIDIDAIWYNPTTNVLSKWDGNAWDIIPEYIKSASDPTIQNVGDGWYNPSTNTWSLWGTPTVNQWNEINPIDAPDDPTAIPQGTYWFDTTNDALNVRNGITWLNVLYSTSPLIPAYNDKWFDTTTNTLYTWDRNNWVEDTPIATAYINECGITFESTATGSSVVIIVPAPENSSATAVCYGTGYADYNDTGNVSPKTSCNYGGVNGNVIYEVREIPEEIYLWSNVTPAAGVRWPTEGYDGKSGTSSYDVIGVGDDGTPDERRELMDSIRRQLGYPVVEVELTKYQLDTAIQGAIESFRKRSSSAYKRGFFFLDIKPQQSSYQLTNKRIGYNKIVSVTSAHRFTSAFLSTAHGGGVYGQVVLQHLYNMGTYDLTSYHLVAQYIEQLEQLFATRLVFDWNERERTLSFYQSFTRDERVLLDCSVERTEQDLLTDRFAKSWIERYALAESMVVLAQIRGKYSSLPGAGGGISLNAADLMATADSYRAELLQQLDDFVVQGPEDFGMGSTFIFG